MYKNNEGYNNPTEGMAISNVMREYRREQRRRFSEKNRRKVYVASPYAGDTKKNMEAVVRYCRLAISKGYMPVASHLMYPQILDDDDPAQRDLGLMFGLALLKLCSEVWVFGPVSQGMELEIREAKRLHIPVKYMEVDA